MLIITITKFILIGPPAGKYDFNFLAPCPSSGLVFSGDKDSLIDHDTLKDLIKKLNEQNNINVTHEIVKNSNHFFLNQENSVINKINNYIKINKI